MPTLAPRRQQRRQRTCRRRDPIALHIFSFRFADAGLQQRFGTVLARGQMDQIAAIGPAYAAATQQGREPFCVDIRTVPALRATPLLDALCRTHTAFPSFLALLTAPAGYRPSIRLDLTGRDGLQLARTYDRAQARWGDKRRAFVTGDLPRRLARAGAA
jgi:hypothetical protein